MATWNVGELIPADVSSAATMPPIDAAALAEHIRPELSAEEQPERVTADRYQPWDGSEVPTRID